MIYKQTIRFFGLTFAISFGLNVSARSQSNEAGMQNINPQKIESHSNESSLFSIDNLDQYLAQSERQYSDLVSGSEKRIRWNKDVKEKTKLSIIYIHGFSASSREISPVTENLADELGANVYYARLSGHGRSENAMAEGSVKNWLREAESALHIASTIGDKVIIISASTGGTLATYLSAQPDYVTKNILANIMISPNFGLASKLGEIVRWDWGLKVARWVNGDYYSFTPNNELHSKYWTERYPIESLVPMMKLVDQVNEIDKSTIKVPQLIIYSPFDVVVDVNKTLEIAKEYSHSEVTLHEVLNSLDPSQHVLAGDACGPEITDELVNRMLKYINELR